MKIDEQLIHTTIRIVSKSINNQFSTGTGFFFRFIFENNANVPTIVTNKHVLKDSATINLRFSLDNNGSFVPGKFFEFNYETKNLLIIDHPDDSVDLCLICIAPLLNNIEQKLHIVYLTKDNLITKEYINENISNIEEITFIGYPDAIIDDYNNLPVVRRGITATSIKYDFNNRKEFLIDSAIYGGSSGSPVFIFNQGSYSIGNRLFAGSRLLLVGIVFAVAQHRVNGELKIIEIPTSSKPISETLIPNNIGFVIKAERLLDFFDILKEKIKSEQTKNL
ncbi:MAG: serine protease [Bacilli bacterium]|nr:serine protease [Bacilli bacterium]